MKRLGVKANTLCSASGFVLSPESDGTQKQLWRELAEKLEKAHPGIMQNI